MPNYSFTQNWFSDFALGWAVLLKEFRGRKNLRYLEIGVYEGRSLFWMAEHILTASSARAIGIDPFQDSEIEKRFLANLKLSGFVKKVEIRKGLSQEIVRDLPLASVDIIYIDGDHRPSSVLADAIQAWAVLKDGGVLIFDDYELEPNWPDKIKPRRAIDSFLESFEAELEILVRGFQVVVRKRLRPVLHWTELYAGDRIVNWTEQTLRRADSSSGRPLTAKEKALILDGKSTSRANPARKKKADNKKKSRRKK